MSEWKTYSGKSVDEAMEEACRSLGAPREKLEVEILSGGSSGIFGLVGKKKAQVRARLREEVNLLSDMGGKGERRDNDRRESDRRDNADRRDGGRRGNQRQGDAQRNEGQAKAAPKAESKPAPKPAPAPVEDRPAPVQSAAPAAPAAPSAPAPKAETPPLPRQAAPVVSDLSGDDEPFEDDFDDVRDQGEGDSGRSNREPRRAAPAAEPQPLTPELSAIVREAMEHMLDGILGQRPEFEISGHSERVSVLIFDEENSGLLIGREGQTLAAIQYIVNRIVIRRHGSPVKVQINTGEYRERQDDNLRKMAIFLADKAKTLGRPQSTKPLSSYHRRVVHLALQEDEGISTRSKGEGPLKRVLILPRGGRGEAQSSPRS
ncbi:Jag family protein [Solidesulfovibrio carbinolicus]|uniref:RNA-binding protein KhpB n=1 Tax=Solidesulfovibrio carbinolicus TaxID=296842 RepID=A0A4P6HI69_9BACT|nr:protein jag [Solidesulfovibrio carbinolicus]QAZ66843.1 single-stranded DNA-binding protein [Solidesulfovibrio carbinolicus]